MYAVNAILEMPIGPVTSIKPSARVDRDDGEVAPLSDGGADVRAAQPWSSDQAERVRVAKDFESLLTTRLVEEMKNTIGDWDDQEDAASQQMQGIFWMHLAQHVGGSGGIGLWKQIVQSMNQNDPSTLIDPSVDDRL